MANPMKGEVGFECEGKQYTFVLGTYAQAALQRRTNVPTFKFFARKPEDWGVDDLLAIMHAGLMRHHTNLTEMEVSDLMDALGRARVQEIMAEGMSLAFPDGGKGGAGRPRIAKSA